MTDAKKNADAGASQVQSKMDEFTEQGFRGVAVDPTPNENYTVAGVTGGAPTPETDSGAKAEALAAANLDDEARLDPDKDARTTDKK